MLMYGKDLKLAGLSNFGLDFWPIEKLLFAGKLNRWTKLNEISDLKWSNNFRIVQKGTISWHEN